MTDRLRVALLVAAFLAAACGGDHADMAQGIVVAIDQTPPVQVHGFTLRTTDGQDLVFVIGDLQLDAGSFNASHLLVHEATSQPIVVAYRTVNGERVAFRLVDAVARATPG